MTAILSCVPTHYEPFTCIPVLSTPLKLAGAASLMNIEQARGVGWTIELHRESYFGIASRPATSSITKSKNNVKTNIWLVFGGD